MWNEWDDKLDKLEKEITEEIIVIEEILQEEWDSLSPYVDLLRYLLLGLLLTAVIWLFTFDDDDYESDANQEFSWK